MVDLEQRLRTEDRQLALHAPTDNVVRVLQIADLDEHLGVRQRERP